MPYKTANHVLYYRPQSCVRPQTLTHINKKIDFRIKTKNNLLSLAKARNFASSKGKKEVTSEWQGQAKTKESRKAESFLMTSIKTKIILSYRFW